MPRHPSPRAFTLLELLVVLAIVGAMAGLAGVGLARSISHEGNLQHARAVAASLASARVAALRTGRPVQAELISGADQLLLVVTPGSSRRWAPPPFTLADEQGRPVERLVIAFAASGRTPSSAVGLVAPGQGSATSGATIMWINFDPISGAPALGARKDPQTGEATAEADP